MTTTAEIDRLVRDNDAIVARLLPRLGPRVRHAYTADRNAWIALRQGADAGKSIPPAKLAAQKQTFSGWARAFRTASGRPAKAVGRPTPPRSAPTPTAKVETALAARSPSHKRTQYALAAGVALVGLAAFATWRKRK